MRERPGGHPIRPKRIVTMDDLEEALTKALNTHAECKGISIQKIVPLSDPGGVANWDAEFAAESGERPTPEQRRVMLAAKLGVQKKLDLADGG
jgi:hypothetical protein